MKEYPNINGMRIVTNRNDYMMLAPACKTEEDYQYEDDRIGNRGPRGGYGGRNQRGGYNKNYGNRNYGNRGYNKHTYTANQFYDSGENDEPEETGFQNFYNRNQNDRRGNKQNPYQKYGGTAPRNEYHERRPTEKLLQYPRMEIIKLAFGV